MDKKITVSVNPEFIDLVTNFFKEWKEEIGPLRQSLEKGNYEPIRIWGHNLKGVGVTCGSVRLSEMGAYLENAAKAMNPDMTAEIIDKLLSYLNCAELIAG